MEKLLFATSNAINKSLEYLSTEYEAVRDFSLGSGNKYISMLPEPQISFLALKDRIQANNDISMLHYSGHSDKNGLEVDVNGKISTVTKDAVANLMVVCPKVRLVFLNSCNSEAIAQEIFKSKVPYVIGTTKTVNDDLAAVAAYLFYKNLNNLDTTIESAFALTQNDLEIEEDEFSLILKQLKKAISDEGINKISKSRGLGDNNIGFWWKLFKNPNENFVEKNKEWTLIPKFEQFEDKALKCLFLFDLKYIEYYKQFNSYFSNANNGNISVLGINDISNDQIIDKLYFEKTCTKSDIIVHLIDARYKEFVNLTGYNFNTFQGKQYSICIDDDFKLVAFKDETWFKSSEVLIEYSFIKLSNEGKNSSFFLDKVIIPKFNEFILNITNRTDLSKLPNDLKAIPFTNEEAQFDKFDIEDQLFSYYFINGTENCTQQLLIKKLKKSFTNDSFETIYVCRSVQNENNIDTELFSNEVNFWKRFITGLKISSDSLLDDIDKGKSRKDICIDTLKEKRSHGNVIIIIDDINFIDFEKLILNDFKTKLEEKTNKIDYKIIVFASSYLGEKINANNKIDIIPLKTMEFQRWKTSGLSIKNHENFAQLSINNILNGTNKTQFRKNAMINICKTLGLGEPNYLNTILDILDYSKD